MVTVTSPNHHIWCEKYRPKTLEETVLPVSIKNSLQKYIKDNQLPSLILYSPSPGTGKTTTAKAIANDLETSPLFINASTDNSIDTIRNLVTQYATTTSVYGDHKIVILDEGDRLSQAAQDGLKSLIEEVSAYCSFIITCNNKGRLIEPLRSRCVEIDFVYTAEQQLEISTMMLRRAIDILKNENIEHEMKVIASLAKTSAPDNRRFLNTLQEYANQHNKIDVGVLALHKARDVSTYVEFLRKKKFDSMLKWCLDNADSIGDDFYRFIYNSISDEITDTSRAGLILLLNDFQRFHSIVPDKFLHFSALSTSVMSTVEMK